jgi:hypothetical protein
VYERFRRLACSDGGITLRVLSPVTAAPCRICSPPHISRKLQPKLNVDRVAVDVRVALAGVDSTYLEPQRDRILEEATQTSERASVRMHPPKRWDGGNPVPSWIPLDLGAVRHVVHVCTQRLPRQGSRSRSIARRVPLGRSPLCSGMTV